MAVPNGAKRRHSVQDKQKLKRFKPGGKPPGGFGPGARFGPPLPREAFGPGPGPFPPARCPGPFPRFGPPPPFARPAFRPPFPPFARFPPPPRFPQRAFRPRPPEPAVDLDRPWVSAEIRAEEARRRRLEREGAWRAAQAARARVLALLRAAERDYLSRRPREPFRAEPDAASKAVDFTEDLKF